MVLKPASETPLTALALAALAEEAGIPKGVFNVITGKASVIGKELTSNPDVRMLTFTGSTEIGAKLMAQCAPTVKKLGLELGGNAPFIVFDDADLDKAVQGAMASKYRNAGQTCVCANRIYVQEGVYGTFAEKLALEVKKMKVGAGTEEGVTTGPLINKAAVEKVDEHIADALKKGASVVVGGKRHALGGNFYEPTILGNVTSEMLVAREETFGPVAPLFKFKTEADVIAQANDTPFGLAAYFYARDVGRVWRVAEALECGIIGINEGIISNEVAPFGGYKQIGPRPRRLPPRHRGISGDQVPADGRAVSSRCLRGPLRPRTPPRASCAPRRVRMARRPSRAQARRSMTCERRPHASSCRCEGEVEPARWRLHDRR